MERKNTRKKMISITLIFVMAFQYLSMILPLWKSNADNESDDYFRPEINGITWACIAEKENEEIIGYTIIPFSGYDNKNSITIPSSVKVPSSGEKKPVVGIGDDAFLRCENLYEIEFPTNEEFTTIGSRAFALCNNLQHVIIPGNVKVIEEYAFAKCQKLDSIIINEGVETIESSAFYVDTNLYAEYPSIINVYLPSTIKEIGNENFNMVSVTNIWCNVGSEYVIRYAKANNLKYGYTDEINYTDSTNGITWTFKVIYDEKEKKEFASDIKLKGSIPENFTIPSKLNVDDKQYIITEINKNLFSNITNIGNLKNLTIENGIESIGKNTFLNCTGLETLKIPGTVTKIENPETNIKDGITLFTEVYSENNDLLPAYAYAVQRNESQGDNVINLVLYVSFDFEDGNLYTKIKNVLEASDIELLYDDGTHIIEIANRDVNEIKELDVSGTEDLKISNFSGLEKFRNLEKINASYNNIKEITNEKLKKLIKLKELNLSHNQIEKVNFYEKMNLEKLDLSYNNIKFDEFNQIDFDINQEVFYDINLEGISGNLELNLDNNHILRRYKFSFEF